MLKLHKRSIQALKHEVYDQGGALSSEAVSYLIHDILLLHELVEQLCVAWVFRPADIGEQIKELEAAISGRNHVPEVKVDKKLIELALNVTNVCVTTDVKDIASEVVSHFHMESLRKYVRSL